MDMPCVRILHLEHIYHGIEEFVDAPAGVGYSGYNRNSEHLSKGIVIEIGIAALQLVEHVQVYHHRSVHIDEFCGEIEVTLKVRGHNNIYYNIGGLLAEVSHHVEFLGGVGRQGICAGKINYVEAVSFVFKSSLLGSDSDSRIVSDMLMGSRNHVEHRCLAAVGVAHQRHIYNLVFAEGYGIGIRLRLFAAFHGKVGAGGGMFPYFQKFYLDKGRLGPAQRHLIVHQGIFHRILQWRVEYHTYLTPSDKSHFHYALSESSVTENLGNYPCLTRFQIR